jgi:hypothetical protein
MGSAEARMERGRQATSGVVAVLVGAALSITVCARKDTCRTALFDCAGRRGSLSITARPLPDCAARWACAASNEGRNVLELYVQVRVTVSAG